MSRLPYPEGVTEVVKLLATVDELQKEAEYLRPFVKRLKEVEELISKEQRRLPELLRSMDVESPGNFGWERRMGWFLAEMHRQLETAAQLKAQQPKLGRAPDERTKPPTIVAPQDPGTWTGAPDKAG